MRRRLLRLLKVLRRMIWSGEYLPSTRDMRGPKEPLLKWTSDALLVQLLLSIDRRDLAQSTYQAAKKIGNDSTLVQAMEAWIGLKTVCSSLSPFFDASVMS